MKLLLVFPGILIFQIKERTMFHMLELVSPWVINFFYGLGNAEVNLEVEMSMTYWTYLQANHLTLSCLIISTIRRSIS